MLKTQAKLQLDPKERDLNYSQYLSLEFLDNVFEEMLVEVLSSEESVAVGGLHLKNSLLDLQD